MMAVALPVILSFALALSFLTLAVEKVKKHSCTAGRSNGRRRR